jgi:type I restriction enzyme S subunit
MKESKGFKETEIGLIPEDWEVVRLGEVFEVKQGKQLSAKENRDGKVLKHF